MVGSEEEAGLTKEHGMYYIPIIYLSGREMLLYTLLNTGDYVFTDINWAMHLHFLYEV